MQFSYIFLVSIFAILGVATSKSVDDCKIFCPKNYAPVCGTDGIKFKVFSNKCMMKFESCLAAKNWRETRMDLCEQKTETPLKSCDTVCQTIYNPVCATNGVRFEIFDNACNLEARNCKDNNKWRLTKMMACEQRAEEEDDCKLPCDDKYNPVCAFDGRRYSTFINECVYNMENCYAFHRWNLMKMGVCPEVWQM